MIVLQYYRSTGCGKGGFEGNYLSLRLQKKEEVKGWCSCEWKIQNHRITEW